MNAKFKNKMIPMRYEHKESQKESERLINVWDNR